MKQKEKDNKEDDENRIGNVKEDDEEEKNDTLQEEIDEHYDVQPLMPRPFSSNINVISSGSTLAENKQNKKDCLEV
jgi:hypothetical protein